MNYNKFNFVFVNLFLLDLINSQIPQPSRGARNTTFAPICQTSL